MAKSWAPSVRGGLAALACAAGLTVGTPARGDDRIFDVSAVGGGAAISGVHDVSGDRTVYTAGGEVYLSVFGGATYKLTATGGACDPSPQIDGNYVVFAATTSGTLSKRVYLVDIAGAKIYPLTTETSVFPLRSAGQPTISGSIVAFSAVVLGEIDTELFVYNLSTGRLTRKTINGFADDAASTDGSIVAWEQGSAAGGLQIARTTVGGSINDEMIVSSNVRDDRGPRVDRGAIVWYGSDGNDLEIYGHNGTTFSITNNNYDDIYPDLAGSVLVWESRFLGADAELTYVDFGAPSPAIKFLTNNAVDDRHPRIGGRFVSALVSTTVSGAAVNVGRLYRERRAIPLPSNELPSQGFAYAYSLYASIPGSTSAYYAASYSYYAYA